MLTEKSSLLAFSSLSRWEGQQERERYIANMPNGQGEVVGTVIFIEDLQSNFTELINEKRQNKNSGL